MPAKRSHKDLWERLTTTVRPSLGGSTQESEFRLPMYNSRAKVQWCVRTVDIFVESFHFGHMSNKPSFYFTIIPNFMCMQLLLRSRRHSEFPSILSNAYGVFKIQGRLYEKWQSSPLPPAFLGLNGKRDVRTYGEANTQVSAAASGCSWSSFIQHPYLSRRQPVSYNLLKVRVPHWSSVRPGFEPPWSAWSVVQPL